MTNKKTLKAKEDKIVKLQAFDSSCFYGNFFFGNDVFNIRFFLSASTWYVSVKKDKSTDYVLSLNKTLMWLNL